MMGITAWAKEEKAKRAAWQDNNELKKRIEELEIQLKQTLDNSISQASALRDRIAELEARLQIDTLNPNRRKHIIQQAAKIAKLKKNLLLAEDLLSDDSYQYYLDSTGKSSALKEQGNG